MFFQQILIVINLLIPYNNIQFHVPCPLFFLLIFSWRVAAQMARVDSLAEYSLKMEHENFLTIVKIVNAWLMMDHALCHQVIDCVYHERDRATFYLHSHSSTYRLACAVFLHHEIVDLAVVACYDGSSPRSLLWMMKKTLDRFDH